MRLGLIIPANRKISPYVDYYTRIFEKLHIPFQTMIWNKQGIDEKADMRFDYVTNDRNRKRMLVGHALFALKCKRYIKKEKIDALIIFTNAPAFFMGQHFLKRFTGRYILDVRDDTPLRRRFPKTYSQICKNSFNIVSSSFMFEKWINRKCTLCHNADIQALMDYYNLEPIVRSQLPISIVYAGMMIEEQLNIDILDRLGNNGDFEFLYFGRNNTGKKIIEQYISEHKINNVTLYGEYKKNEITDIYRNNASLVNILRQNTEINRNALPNKFYDAVISGVPLLVFKHNNAIAEYVLKYHLGIVIENDSLDYIGAEIQNKFQNFDYIKYKAGRKAFLDTVLNDHMSFEETVSAFASTN